MSPVNANVREERHYKVISSAGGRIEIGVPIASRDNYRGETSVETKGVLLDVAYWLLRHRYRNVETPRSGSEGAIRRDRVASEFFFNVALAWNANYFLDNLLNGIKETDYTVGIKLYLGDPNFYPPGVKWEAMSVPPIPKSPSYGVYYQADRVRLDDLAMIVNAGTGKLIRTELSGSSDSVLKRFDHKGKLTEGDL